MKITSKDLLKLGFEQDLENSFSIKGDGFFIHLEMLEDQIIDFSIRKGSFHRHVPKEIYPKNKEEVEWILKITNIL